jgi:LPXTG-site transpeptidase (sortase) family protein
MSRRRLAVYNRRRSNPLPNILSMLMMGIIAGAIFTLFDRPDAPAAPIASPIVIPLTATPEAVVADAVPEPPQNRLPTPPPSQLASTKLFIPTAGVSASIVEVYLDGVSWDVSQLGPFAGHLQGTASLDHLLGNKVLAGHVEMADGQAGIFADIGKLSVGDPLILNQAGSALTYTVKTIKKVAPDDLTVLYPTQTDQLTLITCDSYDFFQDAYSERVVVVAERAL